MLDNSIFDYRSAFGAKLELIIEHKRLSKSAICKGAGISRPTLDKLIAANVTNKANFDKHVEKICDYLKINPSDIIGNGKGSYNTVRQSKTYLQIADDTISEITGIPISRLKEIESGADASIAELRDIAFCCHTGVLNIQGLNYFETLFDIPSMYSHIENTPNFSSTFWGYIGIQLICDKTYHWFPISTSCYKNILNQKRNKYLIITTFNNRLLIIDTSSINNLLLSDEACDPPFYADDTDPNVYILPAVLYDALEDYYLEEIDSNRISSNMLSLLDKIVPELEKIADIEDLIFKCEVYFKSNTANRFLCDFSADSSLLYAIQSIYEFGELPDNDFLYHLTDLHAYIQIININNVAMLSLPLVLVEKAIAREMEEILF